MSALLNKIRSFLDVYAKAALCCARALTLGVASRSERTFLPGICETKGVRVRPAPALLPGISIDALILTDQKLTIQVPESTDGEVGTLELIVINTLVRMLNPKRVFEFGSFRGVRV